MTRSEQVDNGNTNPIIETSNITSTDLTGNNQNSQTTGDGFIEPSATATIEVSSESNKTAEEMAAEIQAALWARDMVTLESLMANPFVMGYWQSEGRSSTSTEIASELSAYRLPANTANLTFTTDRSQFPDLGSIPVDAVFGPNNNTAQIIFSEGWGPDGQGEAFLYLLYDHDGQVNFTSILYAGQSFAGPDPVPVPGPEALAAQIQAALWARDMAALEALMANPFGIGYWLSEGRSDTPAGIVAELSASHLPANTANLTFTTNRSQFPDLGGIPVEGIFGPNDSALIIFSQGWGADSQGEALLYLVYDAAGQAQFSYILVAGQSFEIPDPVPGPGPEALAAQIQAALWAWDMVTLESLMVNPFGIGYWQSEGRSDTPAGIVAELSASYLPANTANLTFTTDRSQFPDLAGIPVEGIFGPNNIALIIFSQGWGADGHGEALLYLIYDDAGQAQFSYILVAGQSFEGPDPVLGPGPEPLAAQIQAALWARDMVTLESLMANPFGIGYWLSEGRNDTPAGIVAELSTYRLPVNTSNLTFTTDRSQFPNLNGMSVDNIFGPNDIALIIYSEGWGVDGQGAAFLYLVYDAAGQAQFSYILFAGQSFD